MESIGIIRRIDDIGRIVLPKEIRNIIKVSYNDPLEISVEKGRIVLTPFNTFVNMGSTIKSIVTALFTHCRVPVVVCDKKETVFSEGLTIEQGIKLGSPVSECIAKRMEYIYSSGSIELYIGEEKKHRLSALIPITSALNGGMGALILLNGTRRAAELTEEQLSLTRFAAFLVAERLDI